jgi:diguanylate cyclase (GGDEF)-like protein
VVRAATRRSLETGDALIQTNTPNETVFLVVTGCVEVRLSGGAPPHIRLGVGECVGELSVIDRSGASADVVASEPTTVIAISRGDVWGLINSSAEVARNLLAILAGRVRQDDQALAESSRLQHELEHLVSVDALTGLRNRAWLDDAFERQLHRSQREGEPVSLLMIDIDRFKQVNDEHGHPMGDAVLRRTARLLAAGLRPQDLVARYGGEEFAVMLPRADAQAAKSIGDRLRRAVGTVPLERAESHLPATTVSVGLATAEDETTLDALIIAADAALYRAKAAGRDRVSD